MDVSIDTSQIGVLQDFFNDLSHVNQRKIFMSSFRKAAKPLVTTSKSFAPYRTGQLMRSIGTVEHPENVSLIVGAKLTGGQKKSGWYGIFSEPNEGKTPHERFWKKRGGGKRSTGTMSIHRFMEPAYELVQEAMYDSMTQEWYNEIDRFIIRTNKKLK
jgi:hypothetical protein